MNNKDLLQIKIERARAQLPSETLKAIDSVDWRSTIYDMVDSKKYNIEQLGDLELETELVLCGLTLPEDYPKELEKRMGVPEERARELVKTMNEKVFKKIRDKMIEDTTGRQPPSGSLLVGEEKSTAREEGSREGLKKTGIEIMNGESVIGGKGNKEEKGGEILARLEKPELEAPHPIVAQKLSGPMKIPSVKTEHTLENLTKPSETTQVPEPQKPPTPPKYDIDPYREVPE